MGGNDSTSTSKPLNARQRQELYDTAISNTGDPSGIQYNAPTYQGFGDYGALENSILQSRTIPLDTAWANRSGEIDQDMSDRGIWSSGAGIATKNKEYQKSFLPAYQQAGAEAATQRYQLQAQDLAAQNAFGLENAQRQYDAGYRPYDYRAGLFNQTGGVISSGNSTGWSI